MSLDVRANTPHVEVKRQLREALMAGQEQCCPTCERPAKIRKRVLNAGMARSLIKLYRADQMRPGQFVHVPTEVGSRDREEGKLRYWGLIEEELTLRDDGGRAGYWRITEKGRQFVRGEIRVPKWIKVYNKKCLGFDASETYSIHDSLGHPFDLNELREAG